MTVHILKHGLPVCRFTREVPRDWPAGHKWIGFNDPEVATLPTCQACRAGIETPPMPRIDAIWAVLSVDEDGNEGVVAAPLQPGMLTVPLIAADEARLESILPLARAIAKATGRPLRLVKFSTRQVVEEIAP